MTAHKMVRFCRPTTATYSRRRRSMPVVVGTDADAGLDVLSEPVDGRLTRFGYQTSRYRSPHDVYLLPDGTLAEIHNRPTHLGEDGRPDEWRHCFVPCADRTIRDRYPHRPIGLAGAVVRVLAGRAERVTVEDGGERHELASGDAGFRFALGELGLA